MSNDTKSTDGGPRAPLKGGEVLAGSDNVRECPIGADGRFATAAQVLAGVTDVQLRAIELLLAGTSQATVARECGVDVRTIYRWRMESEPFRAALDRARRDMWADTIYRMRAMVGKAMSVLEAEIVDEYDRSRVRAATIVLNHSNVRKLMLEDMEQRDD
jgi:hypothetical protein